jgi:hypothetical protein
LNNEISGKYALTSKQRNKRYIENFYLNVSVDLNIGLGIGQTSSSI